MSLIDVKGEETALLKRLKDSRRKSFKVKSSRRKLTTATTKGKKKSRRSKSPDLKSNDDRDFINTTAAPRYIRGLVGDVLVQKKIVAERKVGQGY
jgi:hypothetical protein